MPISPLPKGSTGPPLQFNIVTDALTPVNLTGATMNPLTIKSVTYGTEQTGQGSWSIVNATGGIAQYTLATADTAQASINNTSFTLIVSFLLNSLNYVCDPIPWTITLT